MTKTGLDLVEVAKDIGVIKLNVIYYYKLGQVMDELGAFIEEGAVVFITFDNEELRAAETCALAKIGRASCRERVLVTV